MWEKNYKNIFADIPYSSCSSNPLLNKLHFYWPKGTKPQKSFFFCLDESLDDHMYPYTFRTDVEVEEEARKWLRKRKGKGWETRVAGVLKGLATFQTQQ